MPSDEQVQRLENRSYVTFKKERLFEGLLTSLGSGTSKDDRLEKDKARQNPFYLLENEKLWIKTKDASLIPLVLNKDQKLILKTIKDIQKQGKPVRIWILKARQKGCSTLCEGIIYSRVSQRENLNALIVSDDIEGIVLDSFDFPCTL